MPPFLFEEQIVKGLFEIVNQSSFLKPIVVFFGSIIPWIIVAWFLFNLSRVRSFKLRFYYFALAALSIIISRGMIAETARNLFYSPRPIEFFDAVSIIPRASTSGMPSGHMAILAPLAFTFIAMNKKSGVVVAAFIVLVGIARVAGGAHWISDILVGIIIGIIGFLIAKAILPKKLSIRYTEPAEIDEPKLSI